MIQEYLNLVVSAMKNAAPSIEEYVQRNGVDFQSSELTADEQRIVQTAVKRVSLPFEKKLCFYNSQLLAIADVTRTLRYVEGFAYCDLIPIHHGWCVINEKIVDMTWRDVRNDPICGVIPARWEYRGVFFDTNTLRDSMLANGVAVCQLDHSKNARALMRDAARNVRG